MRLLALTMVVAVLAVGTARCVAPRVDTSAATLDSTVAAIVRAYEAKEISLDSATQHLADAVEPTGGLAAASPMSAEARKLFEATGRELARRAARRP